MLVTLGGRNKNVVSEMTEHATFFFNTGRNVLLS